MTYSQIFTDNGDHLLCITDGMVDNADTFLVWAKAVIAKAAELGRTKILVDNRTFVLNLTALDVITFATALEEMNAASLGLRLAVVSSPKNPEISRLVETSLINRSAMYKGFKGQEEAKEWLFSL